MEKIIYNVTVKISESVELEWLDWMKKVHIPDVMDTACFESAQIQRIIKQDDDGGHSYAIQYLCPSMKILHGYQVHHAQRLQKEHNEKFEGHYAAFRTLMQLIETY